MIHPKTPKSPEVLEAVKNLTTSGTVAQDNGMLYLDLDNDWIFNCLTVLKHFGYITLFSVTLGLVVVAIVYTVVFLKKPTDIICKDAKMAFEEEKKKTALKCDKGNVFVTRTFLVYIYHCRHLL